MPEIVLTGDAPAGVGRVVDGRGGVQLFTRWAPDQGAFHVRRVLTSMGWTLGEVQVGAVRQLGPPWRRVSGVEGLRLELVRLIPEARFGSIWPTTYRVTLDVVEVRA